MRKPTDSAPVYSPPFTVTPAIVSLVASVSEAIGRLSAIHSTDVSMRLRRANRIRTVQGSLAIEGNTLSEEQITAILEGKRVLAPPSEIQEVRNALLAYEKLATWTPHLKEHLLDAHGVIMAGLVDASGTYRTGSVGIMKGADVVHLAPPYENVPALVNDLLAWLKGTEDHVLVASCVFHYEFEFIHPFPDGNGRLGRLWQTLILSRWNPLFGMIPVETLVHQHQAEYYAALNKSNAGADSAPFIEFMLTMIRDAITEVAAVSEKVTVKMSEKILASLRDNPSATIGELATQLGCSTRTVERQLKLLQASNKLKRIGPDKGGHWEVL